MSAPFFEDLFRGYAVTSPPRRVSAGEIIAFASQWDPQPFHVDPEAAVQSEFGQHVGSGAHMYALMMRLGVESGALTGNAVLGVGLDRMRFHRPLLPESNIRAGFTVVALRLSASRKHLGIVRWRCTLTDDTDDVIFSAFLINLYRRRTA